MTHPRNNQQKGFTIVELMIAISVLAVILLIVATGIIQISKTYYKGIIQSTTQQAARTILDDVAQSVQYDSVRNLSISGGPVSVYPTYPGYMVRSICIGQSVRYSYVIGYEESTSKSVATGNDTYSTHTLWKDSASGGCTPVDLSKETGTPPIPPGSSMGGHELLGQNMRLTKFSIQQQGTSNLYKIYITVMYGEDDLFDKGPDPASPLPPEQWKCQATAGVFAAAFCAKSELTTVVGKRLS